MIVVIPAFMPSQSMLDLLEGLTEKFHPEIIVVNDGSPPEYDSIFEKAGLRALVLKHEKNMGKGAALKTAFKYLADNADKSDFVVCADADGQHLIGDIENVYNEAVRNPDSLVLGARVFKGKVPFRSKFGNQMTKIAFLLAMGVKISDTQTGLRAFPVSLLPELINISGDRYEYETNVLLSCARLGIPLKKVKIETVYIRKNKSSHFNPITDSLKIYRIILSFCLSSFSSFLLDYALFLIFSAFTFGMQEQLSLTLSIAMARIISCVFNYVMNRKVVFCSKIGKRRSLFAFALVSVLIYLLNVPIMFLLVGTLDMPRAVAKIITEAALFPLSYILQRKYVFPPENKKACK